MTENEQLPIRSNRCPIDSRSLKNDAMICEECARVTRERLADIPKMYVLAESYLIPGRSGTGGSGSHSGHSDGFNGAAMDFRHAFEILAILEDWERTVRVKSLGQTELDGQEREGEVELDEDGLIKTIIRAPFSNERPVVRRGSVEKRIAGVCEFLLKHSPWLTRYEAAGDFVTDVAAIWSQGQAATKQSEEKPTRIKCPADIEMWIDGIMKTVICNQMLTLTDDLKQGIHCRGCDTNWTLAQLLAVAVTTPGAHVLLDPVAIGGYLGMELTYVHKFAKRHGIEKVGKKYPLVEFVAKRNVG